MSKKKLMRMMAMESLEVETISSDTGHESDANPFSVDDTSDSGLTVSSSDQESVAEKIRFIEAKQKILKQAAVMLSEEELYDASTALSVCEGPNTLPSETQGSIWNEAKGILRALNTKASETDAALSRDYPRPSIRGPSQRSRKRPKIDTSRVQRIDSTVYDPTLDLPAGGQAVNTLCPVQIDGMWMAQALLRSSRSQGIQRSGRDRTYDNRWKIVSDPTQRYSVGLLPPSHLGLKSSIDIQEAMSVSQEARLVTMSTPPFSVVHANKAFLHVAGCQSCDIVGVPVESIFQVSSLEPLDSNEGIAGILFESQLLNQDIHVNIRVIPVVDRRSMCLSHVLVQLVGRTDETTFQPQVPPVPRVADPLGATRDHAHSHEMVGAMG